MMKRATPAQYLEEEYPHARERAIVECSLGALMEEHFPKAYLYSIDDLFGADEAGDVHTTRGSE